MISIRRFKTNKMSTRLVEKDRPLILMEACQSGFTEVCELLIEHNADPFHRNATSETAVMFAARYGHKRIVQLLDHIRVQRKPPVGFEEDVNRDTALHRACRHGHVRFIAISASY